MKKKKIEKTFLGATLGPRKKMFELTGIADTVDQFIKDFYKKYPQYR